MTPQLAARLAAYGVRLRSPEEVLGPAWEAYDRAIGRETMLPPPPDGEPGEVEPRDTTPEGEEVGQ